MGLNRNLKSYELLNPTSAKDFLKTKNVPIISSAVSIPINDMISIMEWWNPRRQSIYITKAKVCTPKECIVGYGFIVVKHWINPYPQNIIIDISMPVKFCGMILDGYNSNAKTDKKGTKFKGSQPGNNPTIIDNAIVVVDIYLILFIANILIP